MLLVVIQLSSLSQQLYKNALIEFKKTQQAALVASSPIGPISNAVALSVPRKKNLRMAEPYTQLYKALVLLTPQSKRAKLTVVLRSVRRTQIVQHSSSM